MKYFITGTLIVLATIWFGAWFAEVTNGDEWFIVPSVITISIVACVGLLIGYKGIE